MRSVRLQGLLEVGRARLLVAMLGGLGVSTLHLIKTMTQFSSLFWGSNQSCYLLQCSGTTLRERLWRPLVFFIVSTCWETYFSLCRYSTYFFLSFFFGSSYRPSGPPRCSDTTLWVCHWCPLNFFIVVSIYWKSTPIGRHLTSLRSARLQTGRLLSWFLSLFSFWIDVHAIRPVHSFNTSSWLSRGRCAYTSLEGLWGLGTSGSLPTRLMAVLDKWVWPTRRPADLICVPHDLLKIF
jgi:hypothetical protein